MAYIINKTDGTPIASVADGQVDQLSTDITLIGKNYSGFGEFLNENFIKLLENFASASQPNNPLPGQLWYDVREGRIKIYSGTQWTAVGTATLSENRPLTVGVGDFWFNSIDKQLFFFDGSRDYLIAPAFTAQQGVTGFRTETIEDSSRRSRTVAALFVGGTLVGYFSSVEFTPRNRIVGYEPESIKIGFNPANVTDFKFRGSADNADTLGNVEATVYARKDIPATFEEQLTVQTELGIAFGTGPQGRLTTTPTGDVNFRNIADSRSLNLIVTKNNNPLSAIEIIPTNTSDPDRLIIFNNNSNSQVDIGGSLTVVGNLTVLGNSVAIDVETLKVQNKFIELGATSDGTNISDVVARGGGLVLKGDTDHFMLWNLSETNSDLANWDFSENINIPQGKSYKINDVPVIEDLGPSGIVLTSAVTSAPGLTSFGAQISITSDNITINNNRISNNGRNTQYIDGGSPNPFNIFIEPAGDILVEGTPNPRIVGIRTSNEDVIIHGGNQPESAPYLSSVAPGQLTEAASKRYVTNFVRTRSIALALDITGLNPIDSSYPSDAPLTESEIVTIITRISPPEEYDIGTIARVSTFRYYMANVEEVLPTLTVTKDLVSGYVTAVAANIIPQRSPARRAVRRGYQEFVLNASGGPSGKSWIRTIVEEDPAPSATYPAIFT